MDKSKRKPFTAVIACVDGRVVKLENVGECTNDDTVIRFIIIGKRTYVFPWVNVIYCELLRTEDEDDSSANKTSVV